MAEGGVLPLGFFCFYFHAPLLRGNLLMCPSQIFLCVVFFLAGECIESFKSPLYFSVGDKRWDENSQETA